jgi:glycosyltransferase involved in cell wall biosynthesis
MRDGVHGLSIPPKDVDAAANALARIVANRDFRARAGSAARQLFETSLRWDDNAEQMEEIFLEASARSVCTG